MDREDFAKTLSRGQVVYEGAPNSSVPNSLQHRRSVEKASLQSQSSSPRVLNVPTSMGTPTFSRGEAALALNTPAAKRGQTHLAAKYSERVASLNTAPVQNNITSSRAVVNIVQQPSLRGINSSDLMYLDSLQVSIT